MIFLSFLPYHEDVFDSDTNEPPLKACSQTDKFINNFTFQTFKLRTTISENISKIVILTPVFIWSHLTNHINLYLEERDSSLFPCYPLGACK